MSLNVIQLATVLVILAASAMSFSFLAVHFGWLARLMHQDLKAGKNGIIKWLYRLFMPLSVLFAIRAISAVLQFAYAEYIPLSLVVDAAIELCWGVLSAIAITCLLWEMNERHLPGRYTTLNGTDQRSGG